MEYDRSGQMMVPEMIPDLYRIGSSPVDEQRSVSLSCLDFRHPAGALVSLVAVETYVYHRR